VQFAFSDNPVLSESVENGGQMDSNYTNHMRWTIHLVREYMD
jgi:hypothetical protein